MDILDQLNAFLESPLFSWLVTAVLGYLGVLWFSMVLWVTRDIIHRSNSLLFQTGVILMNLLLPVFGLLVYLIVRPPKTLTEKYYEELEYHFLNEQQSQSEACTRCEKTVESDFLFCPHCETQLKAQCASCKHSFSSEFLVCPYCGKKEKSRKPILTSEKTTPKSSTAEKPQPEAVRQKT